MKKGDIERINELARKAKTVGLTPEENEERAKLRRAYIDSVVGDLRQQLDNTYIVDAKGNKRKLRQRPNRRYSPAPCASSSTGTVTVNRGFLVL